ncbi:MAG TPA: SxtJ family membrane protein [Gemmataceae bacterium]|nr:SxtJ family membrane protein [Gemmataceae bacterium]
MEWSDITFTPSRRTLRQFAGLWVICFGGFAVWNGLLRERPAAGLLFAILAGTVGPLGLVRPASVRLIYVGWMVAAFPVGWLVSRVALAIIFFGVFTPLALAFRIAGRDPLELRRSRDRNTYWSPKPPAPDVQSYFRQS